MTIEVRRADSSDARGIAEMHVLSWQQTYAHLVPVEILAGVSVEQRARRWAEIVARDDLDLFVALDGHDIIGFAGASSGRDPDSPRERELETLYLLADYQGTGIGQRLLDAVLGSAAAFLWVADDNPRARAFYARNGFVPDGTTKTGPLAGTPILEARLVR